MWGCQVVRGRVQETVRAHATILVLEIAILTAVTVAPIAII